MDYNAVRLARTEISHAYQLSLIRTAAANPFASGIIWHKNSSHDCEYCENMVSRNPHPINDCPLDHPNGFCTFTVQLEKSLDQIADEVMDWVNGGENKRLDEFMERKYIEKPKKYIENPKKVVNVGLTGAGIGGIIKDSKNVFSTVTPEAYDNITNLEVFDDFRDNELQNAMKYVLDNVKDKVPGTETLVLYSYNKFDFINETTSKTADGVVEAINSNEDYISIHNHASGQTFSLGDVGQLIDKKNCRGIFVVGNNGNMYGLVKSENYNSTDFFEYYMKQRLGIINLSNEEFMKGSEKYGVKYYERTN